MWRNKYKQVSDSFKKSDGQTNIDKYRVVVNTKNLQTIILKQKFYFLQRWRKRILIMDI